MFNEKEIEEYLQSVYYKVITKGKLSVNYHAKVAEQLYKGLVEGYGRGLAALISETPQYKNFVHLRTNIFEFSAAKQYQQVRVMTEFINTKGELSTFNEFKALAGNVFTEYNETYLKAEYQTAISQSRSAREFFEYEYAGFELMEYVTQKDSHVRHDHVILDGIKKPINDSFWNTFWPPNGWNCRCYVQPAEGEETQMNKGDLRNLKKSDNFPELFQSNPATTGMIFDKRKHPYFKVPKVDRELKDNNFNLPKV